MVTVVWGEEALLLREYLIFYGSLKFGKKSAIKLNNRFEELSALLSSNPRVGSTISLANVQVELRSIVIHKRYRVFYVLQEREYGLVVKIIHLSDTRSNPVVVKDDVGRLLQ